MSKSYAQRRLELGTEWPYDAPDEWRAQDGDEAPPPPLDWAHAAARGVIADLTDRRDIKRGFENVDEEVRFEIVASLAEIMREALAKAEGHSLRRLRGRCDMANFSAGPWRIKDGSVVGPDGRTILTTGLALTLGYSNDPEPKANAQLIAEAPQMKSRIVQIESLLYAILDAEQHFRDALPEEWDGDPIHDACERARVVLEQGE
jgi:hypothetical protein